MSNIELIHDALGRSLSSFAEGVERVARARFDDVPASASSAYSDHHDQTLGHELWGDAPILAADQLSVMRLIVASQHARLLSGQLHAPTASAATLSRASLEASAQVKFLATPEIAALERLRRWANVILAEYFWKAESLRAYGDQDIYVEEACRGLINVATAGEAAGLGRCVRPGGRARKPPYFGNPVPTFKKQVEALFDPPRFGAGVYSTLSTAAHAESGSFVMTGLVGQLAPSLDEPGGWRKPTFLHFPTLLALGQVTNTLGERLGWDISEVIALYNIARKAWDAVGATAAGSAS